MPELPDVERFKRVLDEHALGKTIEDVVVSDARILGDLSVRTFSARLRGSRILEAWRHGKHLMAKLDRGGWLTMHFGMTGALSFIDSPEQEPAFTRVRLDFAKHGCLAYVNKRMLGRVGVAKDASDFIAEEKLGPDALDPRLDLAAFETAVHGLRRDVKSVLMDQEIIAGIGNIYSDEILFQARINPRAPVNTLTAAELKRLFDTMRQVLETAVARGAGSEEFTDRMPKGSLLPQRKAGGICPRCGSPLKVFKLGGRTAYCCPRCQGC